MADPSLSQRKLEQAFQDLIAQEKLIRLYGWKTRRDGHDIFVEMRPRARSDLTFMLRIRCNDFPQEPPSYLFVHPKSLEVDTTCWPQGSAFKREWPGICLNGTREFYAPGRHPDRRSQWNYTTFSFARVLQDIQVELNRAYA